MSTAAHGDHADAKPPSRWVARFLSLAAPGGTVLDVAAGAGRHTRLALDLGHAVWAVDRRTDSLADVAARRDCTVVEADLEDGSAWPLPDRRFDAVIVTDYLYRPLLPRLVEAVAPAGLLIYETFGLGNAAFGRPANPDFLLRPGELLDAVANRLLVLAYEHGEVATPRPAVRQRICAWHGPRGEAAAPPAIPDPSHF